ncbi:MAG: hypothetical protein QM664_07430 [Flavihumibacter sp.]
MQNILLPLHSGNHFILRFFDALHPTWMPVQPNAWKYIYSLHRASGEMLDEGLYSGHYYISNEADIFILEEYNQEIVKPGLVQGPDDIRMNLRIFDFTFGRTARFSGVSNGYLRVKTMEEGKIYFDRIGGPEPGSFEMPVSRIVFKSLPC